MSDRYARYERLKFERPADGVLRIVMSNPGKLNAADVVMHRELAEIWRDVDADPDVRCAILTGDFGAVTFLDVSASWRFDERVTVRVGAENVFDKYPDEAVFQASRGLIYSRNSPYDTNGGQYYARVDVRF